MKTILTILISLSIASCMSYAFLGSCQDKRFSRQMEYKLMQECMSSSYYSSYSQQVSKLNACACYVASLACEYDGKDKKLNKAAEKGKLKNDEKEYNKCLEDAKD